MREFYAVILWNVVVFAIYGLDKYKAKTNQWRVKESQLITYAFLMGAVGAMAGMFVFRHKTKKPLFRVMIPVALLCNIAMLWYAEKLLG